jgi:hypothetical protein
MMLQRWLPQQLEANHDLTLEEHREAFEEELGETVSTSTVGRAIVRFLPGGGGWPIKKVARSPRARGGGEGPVALAGLPLRREAAGVRGRVRVQYLDGASEGPGAQR